MKSKKTKYEKKIIHTKLRLIDDLRDDALRELNYHGDTIYRHILDEAADMLEDKWGLERAWSRGLYL